MEERKLVTVLFADITGSTTLGERFDPERWRVLLQRFFSVMTSTIEAWGGTVQKFMGDSVMATFGVPIVREDDAERALRAACQMLERLTELNTEFKAQHGVSLAIRVGVNTGEVMAASDQNVVTGDAVNVAARLEHMAEPGTILAGERTYAAARDAFGIITNPTNKKDMGAKLKQAGITYAQYRAWLKQPHFADYITKISEHMLNEHVADVHTKVVEKAAGGDIQAMRLYYELTGRHDPQKQQMVDLNGVIGLLLEVITRYVTDTTALSKITQDIDLILSGGTPRALEQFDMTRIIDGEVVELEATPSAKPPANEPIGEFFSDTGVFDFKD